ncbi:MAG: CHAT domain-containing protein [Bacteroidales bacterium]
MKTICTIHKLLLFSALFPAITGVPQSVIGLTQKEVENVRSHLETGEVVMHYTLTDTSLQINVLGRDILAICHSSLDPVFWSGIRLFRKRLSAAEPSDFLIPGEEMYHFLIKPVEGFLAGIHRLIIITDERLWGVPFEAFIQDDGLQGMGHACDFHYLLNDFEIVYRRSLEIRKTGSPSWQESGCRSNDACQVVFAGFSSLVHGDRRMTGLPGSGREINAIAELFCQKGIPSLLLTGDSMLKTNFEKTVGSSRIFHLATHCIPNRTSDGLTGFLFENSSGEKSPQNQHDLLSLNDLNELKLEADLIVLNACGSGMARSKSEPVDGFLPQMLAKAGAKNVLSALWNVTDNLAELFLVDFYRTWMSGKTYSAALREVKLQWISRRATAMPTLWAPYVLLTN